MKRLIVGLLVGALLATTGTATAFVAQRFTPDPYSNAKLTRIVIRQHDAIVNLNVDVESLASCMALPDGKETQCLEDYGWNVP